MASPSSPCEASHVAGRTDTPLCEQTLGELIDRVAEDHGDADALISAVQGVRLNYRDLRDEIDRVARGLLALGLGHGDRIGEGHAPSR